MAILVSERLDIRLTSLYPDFSRSRIKGLIEAGFVKVNGEAVLKAGAKVSETDGIEVFIPPPYLPNRKQKTSLSASSSKMTTFS